MANDGQANLQMGPVDNRHRSRCEDSVNKTKHIVVQFFIQYCAFHVGCHFIQYDLFPKLAMLTNGFKLNVCDYLVFKVIK